MPLQNAEDAGAADLHCLGDLFGPRPSVTDCRSVPRLLGVKTHPRYDGIRQADEIGMLDFAGHESLEVWDSAFR
jgi:hypothetical protein